MEHQYDLIIIGSGPAGLSAAIYANRSGLDFVVLESNFVSGGQVLNTHAIDNYPGMLHVEGYELGMKMYEHAKALGTTFLMKKAVGVKNLGEWKEVTLEDQSVLQAENVILATGNQPTLLGVEGEKRLYGHGVSYCATCDGNFFKGKIVAVVGGGNTALADAVYLSAICEKVYLIHRRNDFRGNQKMQDKVFALDNVEVLWNTVVEEIIGEEQVESLKICNTELDMTGEIHVDAVFIAVGSTPMTDLIKELVNVDDYGYVIAGESCLTSCKGIYVAGDIRKKPMRQIVTAVSDGANAVQDIILSRSRKM